MFGHRTVQQSNIIELNRTPQQSETRTSFIWSETKRCGQISYLLASISNTSITGKISDRAEVKLTILEAVVKCYHECSFAVRVGDKFVVKQKRGDRGPPLRVTDDDRGQLGHLQRDLVTVLCYIVNESISNQPNNKDFSSLKCVNISHTCSSS